MTNNTKYQKKIKNIQRMMIAWAEHQVDGKKRDLPDDWKPNFKWLLKLENADLITKHDMKCCNEYHKHYGDPKGIMRNVK
jgi:hypothetical protein|tara:strand:+ start:117 stop:356 length:240 start_codon:yes stop_codon:yes gene_type:complete